MNASTESIDPSVARAVIDKSVELLERKCIRLNGREPNWRQLLLEQVARSERPTSAAEFEKRVNDAIVGGGLSHVAFFHQSAQRAPARYAINATFCSSETRHGHRWIFQDVHEGGPAHAAGIRPGDVLLRVNGRDSQPPELPTFALGTDAEASIDDGNHVPRPIQIVLPKAEPGKGNAKPPMAEPTSVTAREIQP